MKKCALKLSTHLLACLLVWQAGDCIVFADEPSTPPSNAIELRVDSSVGHQDFEGWGVSLCWWANMVGKWNETNIQEIVRLAVDPQQGLGYNIFRYNIGGGDDPEHHHIVERGAMEGYLPGRGKPYNWNADATQRRVLGEIVRRNPDVILEAFANSPPWWMTISGCCAGARDAGDNLKPECFDEFADYLTEVVQHFRTDWNIRFRTLEPLNEPDGTWWKAMDRKQEGCHFSRENQARIINAVAGMIRKKGLTNLVVSAADANSIERGLRDLKSFDSKTLDSVGQLNVHTYAGRRARQEFAQFAADHNKPVWMSESGPMDWPGGNLMDVSIWFADLIIHDVRGLEARAWVDWQLIDGGVWGTIHANWKEQTFSVTKRFAMHSQFSRFIRPGAQIIDTSHENTLAAINRPSGELALVLLNPSKSKPRNWNIDLSRFGPLTGPVHVHRTSPTEDIKPQPDLTVVDGHVILESPPYSITTLTVR